MAPKDPDVQVSGLTSDLPGLLNGLNPILHVPLLDFEIRGGSVTPIFKAGDFGFLLAQLLGIGRPGNTSK